MPEDANTFPLSGYGTSATRRDHASDDKDLPLRKRMKLQKSSPTRSSNSRRFRLQISPQMIFRMKRKFQRILMTRDSCQRGWDNKIKHLYNSNASCGLVR